jgi:hypothetical protein
VRGGYNVTPEFYLGGRFNYYLGYSVDVPGGSVDGNEMLFGIEGGYDVHAGDALTIRPKLGLGLAVASFSSDVSLLGASGSASDSSSGLYIEPGAVVLYDVAQDIFLGGELAIPVAMQDETIMGLTLNATVGMKF